MSNVTKDDRFEVPEAPCKCECGLVFATVAEIMRHRSEAHREPLTSKDVSVPYELMHRLYNVLAHYANEVTYQAPRIGGIVQGCPRGETPTPDKLVWSARWMLRELERKVLKRDAWDWIGKYEPVGPHCDTCRCNAHETVDDEPAVMGAGSGALAPMPTAQEAIEAHVRQIQILCDHTNRDPTEWLSDNAAQGDTGDYTQLHGALVRVNLEARGCPKDCSHEFHTWAIASILKISTDALARVRGAKETSGNRACPECNHYGMHDLTCSKAAGYWQCPCCQNYYTSDRILCPVSGDSRPAEKASAGPTIDHEQFDGNGRESE